MQATDCYRSSFTDYVIYVETRRNPLVRTCFAINSFVFAPAGGRPVSHLPNSSGTKRCSQNFAFLTYLTYQNSNALFNLRLLLVLGWVLTYGNWSIEDDQMQTRISRALRAVTEKQIKITKTKLPLAFNFQNVIPTLASMKSCKIRKFILLENTWYSFIASSFSFN